MGIMYQGSPGAGFGLAGSNHSQGMVPDPGSISTLGRVLTDQGWGGLPPAAIPSSFTVTGTLALPGTENVSGTISVPSGGLSGTIIGQFPGTSTNSNASSGNIGEYVTSSNVTGVVLSNNTPANITSITLSAGDWDISGYAGFTAGAATTLTFFEANICTTSASFASPLEAGTLLVLQVTSGFGANSVNDLALPMARGSFSGSTTIYLNMEVTFSAGSCNGQGRLRARRVR